MSGSRILVKILRAMAARALFIIHALVTIWAAIDVTKDNSIWTFSLISLGIVVEGSYAIIMRAGDERKWFSPSVFLYILSTAPPIWILETKLCEWRAAQNVSELDDKIHLQLLEQVMLCVLIVGRWLLPKGEISREQLSQILLAYLAISSDIVEFFDVFKEKVVYRDKYIQYMVLSAWTSSLLQFPFVLTVSRARKMRVAITDEEMPVKSRPHLWQAIYDVDLWAILLANSLQDIPFFIIRLYLMMNFGLVTYTMMFFISKNALIVLLQTYRAFVLLNDRYWHPHNIPMEYKHKHVKKKARRRTHKKKLVDSERVPIYNQRSEYRSYGGTPSSKSPHRRKFPPPGVTTIEE
uniref:Transmembrane protein 26 n=1 Tax=Acrobeloides nanus TaxID=290746 RepID=A0A914DNT6_9BILA